MKKLIQALLKSGAGRLILGIILEQFKQHLMDKIKTAGLDVHTTQNIEAFLQATDLEDFIDKTVNK